jgi:RNA polymerase sigma factor (sigma-70 family)
VAQLTISACEALAQFLGPASNDDAEALLAGLLIDHALPAVKNVVGRRLGSASLDVREDVTSDALAALVSRLRMLRRDPASGAAIADFPAYAAGVAGNSVHQYLASRHPERTRLRRRIRMVCTTDPRFRIWETGLGFWLCGQAGWGGDMRATAGALEECRTELATCNLPKELPELLAGIFAHVLHPVELNDLLFLCAGLLGVVDDIQDLDPLADRLPDLNGRMGPSTDTRAWMTQLWNEIKDLPDRQRMALLLNLRTPGGAAIGLFEDLGVASFAQLSSALQMAPGELAAIWDQLPLSDKEISEKIGVERQQVINLRSAARERLSRRMNALPILWKTAPQ